MKLFKKSTMSLALTAAMLGGLATAQYANAAVTVNSGNDQVGDILLYPYYTTENGFKTLVHIVNTSKTDTTIAKVRLRDYKNSHDVLDFTVVLSPDDIFSGTIHADANENPVFTRSSDDTTCTSPIATNRTFSPSLENLNAYGKSGHAEVITMATIPHDIDPALYPSLAEVVAKSTHSTASGDTPTGGCGIVDSYFDLDNSDSRTIKNLQAELTAYNAAGGKVNSNLFGHFTVLNQTTGVQAGGRPTTINGALDGALASPCDETGAANTSTICAQVPAKGHFTFPHLLHVAGVDAANSAAAAANVLAFNTFQDAIAANGMANEWSNNLDNAVKAEMIYTLPTKYVINDSYPAATSASTADWNNKVRTTSKDALVGTPYVSTETSQWDEVDATLFGEHPAFNDANGCLSYSTTAFDREEQKFTPAGQGTSTSGGQENAPDPAKEICNEVTAITFGEGKPEGVTQMAGSDVVFGVNTDVLAQSFGWLKVYAKDQNDPKTDAVIPMIGYTMWSRTFGSDLSDHYGHIMNNVKLGVK